MVNQTIVLPLTLLLSFLLSVRTNGRGQRRLYRTPVTASMTTNNLTLYRVHRPTDSPSEQPFQSICEGRIATSAPSVGSVRELRGRLRGSYVIQTCQGWAHDGVPARAYRVQGNGHVLQVSASLRSGNEPYSISVYHGCISGLGFRRKAIAESALPTLENNDSTHGGSLRRPRQLNYIRNGTSFLPEPRLLATTGSCVPGHTHSQVRWLSEQDEEYTIVIHAVYRDIPQGSLAFIMELSTLASFPACDAAMEDYGSLAVGEEVSKVYGATSGTLITDLPTCGPYTRTTPASLITMRVVETDVLVKATLEGSVSLALYQGTCKEADSWTCAMDHDQLLRRRVLQAGEASPNTPTFLENRRSGTPNVHSGDYSFDVKSVTYDGNSVLWHNSLAGTSYLLAITNCCGLDTVDDFQLSVQTSRYGDLCRDPKIMDVAHYSDTSTFENALVYREFLSCHRKSMVYTFTGTGETALLKIADGDMFSTYLTVYETATCQTPIGCTSTNYFRDSLAVSTRRGHAYFVVVSREDDNIMASFNISITTEKGDLCTDAVDLGAVSKANALLQLNSSTYDGGLYYHLRACYSDALPGYPAKVFSFQVKGRGDVAVHIQTQREIEGYFQAQAYIFVGSCGSARCLETRQIVDGDDYTHTMWWGAKPDTKYYVVVMGSSPFYQHGGFEVTVEKLAYGNACQDAVPVHNVSNGMEIPISNLGLPRYQFKKTCADEILSPAVIYSITLSQPHAVLAEIDNYYSTARLNVFKDTGHDRRCNQDTWDCLPNNFSWKGTTWKADANITYYIVVDGCCGPSARVNDFLSFKMQESSKVCDDVNDLGILDQNGSLVFDTTVGKPYYHTISCHSEDLASSSVIYSVKANATGKLSAVAMTKGGDSARVLVYRGSCDSLICVGNGSEWESVIWDAQEGRTYFIAVQNANSYSMFDSGGIEFALKIDTVELSDLCSFSRNLGDVGMSGLLVLGSTTEGRAVSGVPTCHGQVDSLSIAYTMTPTYTGTYVISVDSRQLNLSLATFSGECGAAIECVGELIGGNIVYEAVANETIHILVSGCCLPSTGAEFALTVQPFQEHEVCSESEVIELLSGNESHIIVGSTMDGGYFPSIFSCDTEKVRSRAKLYSISTHSKGIMQVEVLPFSVRPWNARVSVFHGPCDSIFCVRYESSTDGRSFTWNSNFEGEEYYIMVYSDDMMESGNFFLTVQSITMGSVCADTTDMGTIPVEGLVFKGSINEGARRFAAISECFTEINSPVKLYKITTDRPGTYSANVWSNRFDAKVSVYQGNCQDESLQCVSFGFSGNNQVVHWRADGGVSFYVAVYGSRFREATSEFVLNIQSDKQLDACTGAIDLGRPTAPEVVIRGSTENSGLYEKATMCHGFYQSSPGVLYKLEGTGEIMIVSVRGEDFSPLLMILENACDNLFCNHEYPIQSSGHAWQTGKGITYHLLVFGSEIDERGEFVLSVWNSESTSTCRNTERVVPFPSSGVWMFGTTKESNFAPELAECHDAEHALSRAKIYSVTPPTDLFISAEVHSPGLDASLIIYRGGCDEPITCVANGGYVSWNAAEGTTYNVAVMGSGPRAVGDFFWTIQYMPTGNFCLHSSDLGPITQIRRDRRFSTKDGLAFSVGGCYDSGTPGHAFMFTGTGRYITASLSNLVGGDYNAHFALLQGNCSNLQCKSAGYGYLDYTWESEVDVEYFVSIHACCGSNVVMEYDLGVFETEVGNMCVDAIKINDTSPSQIAINSSRSDIRVFHELLSIQDDFESRSRGPAIVYSLEGRDTVIVATAGPGVGLVVLQGNCSNPTKVASSWYESSVTWNAELDAMYYLAAFPFHNVGIDAAVFHGNTESVDIAIQSIQRVSPCKKEFITDLGTIPLEGFHMRGTLSLEPIFDGMKTCSANPQPFSTPGVVVTFIGNGQGYNFYVEGEGVFNPRVNFFYGPCDALECGLYSGNEFETSFSLITDVGVEYTIHVDDCCKFTGTAPFSLRAIPLDVRMLMSDNMLNATHISRAGRASFSFLWSLMSILSVSL